VLLNSEKNSNYDNLGWLNQFKIPGFCGFPLTNPHPAEISHFVPFAFIFFHSLQQDFKVSFKLVAYLRKYKKHREKITDKLRLGVPKTKINYRYDCTPANLFTWLRKNQIQVKEAP
jgi:hypothetical protein